MHKKDDIDHLFDRLGGEFDLETPNLGHQQRFLDRLNSTDKTAKKVEKKRFNWWMPLAVAASLALVFTVFFQTSNTAQPTLAEVSPHMEETQLYFAALIEQELQKVQAEDNEDTKKIVADAMIQLKNLEKDYELLKKDLLANGDDRRLIQAMISNFQNRITLLESVLTQIELVKSFKNDNDENNTI